MISKIMRMTICYLLMGIILLASLSSCGKAKDEEDMRGITDKVEDATLDIATADVATEMEATPMDAELQETSTASDADAEQEPEKNGKIIVLDPGHSNIVTGNMEPLGPGSSEMKAADATGTHGTTSGLTEIELDFQIATKLKTELEDRGYTVILTRYDNDTAISCSERAIIANDAGADAFIRIHADGSDSSSASGAMGICITQSNPYIASMYSECRKLSDDILNAYVAETGFSSRGVWETDTMTGNNWATVPTTLLELGFMTNPNEDTLMADSDFQNKMVRGIANGVDKYCFTD